MTGVLRSTPAPELAAEPCPFSGMVYASPGEGGTHGKVALDDSFAGSRRLLAALAPLALALPGERRPRGVARGLGVCAGALVRLARERLRGRRLDRERRALGSLVSADAHHQHHRCPLARRGDALDERRGAHDVLE